MRYILTLLLLTSFNLMLTAQDTLKPNPEILELRMQLIQARMQLIDKQLNTLIALPDLYQEHILFLDSNLATQRDSIRALRQVVRKQEVLLQPKEPEFPSYTSIIHLDPYRLFEGSLQLGYEHTIGSHRSIDGAILGTYVTRGGLGGGYLKQNDLELLDPISNEYRSYDGDMFTGLGFSLKLKNFLGSNASMRAPLGLYAGPQILYRHVTIRGIRYDYNGTEYVQNEITRNLDIISGGVVVGGKFRLLEVFSVDVYVGGLMRLSTYFNESGFTRYKKWSNIDYSGVLPTAGVNIGILH